MSNLALKFIIFAIHKQATISLRFNKTIISTINEKRLRCPTLHTRLRGKMDS